MDLDLRFEVLHIYLIILLSQFFLSSAYWVYWLRLLLFVYDSIVYIGVSVLGPLLFNIFLHTFFIDSDILCRGKYAFLSAKYLGAIESLQWAAASLSRKFKNNILKGNADNCNFLVIAIQEVSLNIKSFKIKSSNRVKSLCVKFDFKFYIFTRYILFVEKLTGKHMN